MSQPSTIQVNYYEPNDLVFNNEDLCYAVKLEIEVLQRGFGAIKTYTANFVSGTKGIDMISGNGQVLTTSYTDVNMFEIENGGNRESLGVESINIKYNSWYFPEVTIKFVDVRGNAVFNSKERENDRDNNGANGSFFNALFMFPYPLYRLTVKGYYGSPVAYNLTVRDMRATFNNATGNFEITVDFIGHAYGYLVDIPSRLLFLAPSLEYGRMKPSTHIGNFMNGSDKGKRIPTFTQMIKDLYSIERYKTEDEAYISSGDKIQYLTNNLQQYYEIERLYETIISLIDTAASEGFINTPSYLSSSGKIKITASSTDETTYDKIKGFIEQLRKYDEAITEKVNIISKIQTEYDKLSDSVKPENLKINLQVDSVRNTNSTTSPNLPTATSPSLPLPSKETPLLRWANFIYNSNVFISINLIQSNDGDDETLVKTVSEIIRKHEELIARQENLQTAIIEDFFETSLQWRPTINNVFEIVLAHLKYFHSSMQQCISNIETNQAKRLASKIHTDCNSKQDTISLPPFPAFYNESDKHVWCGEVFTDNKLEEEALVDAYFKAAGRTKEVLQTEVENYVSYTQNVDVYPRKWMIPTLLSDLKNGTNQYLKCREVEQLAIPMDGDDIPYCFRILAMRIINRRFYNVGGLSARDFGVLEAYNMLRGQYNPKNLKHSVWTNAGEDMVTVVSECIAKYLKDKLSENFTDTLNDMDVKWNGMTYVNDCHPNHPRRMNVIRKIKEFYDPENQSMDDSGEGTTSNFEYKGLYLEHTLWNRGKILYISSEEEYKLAMDRNIYGIVSSAGCDIDQYKKVFPDRVPIRHISSTLKPEETAITPATHFAVITSSGTLRLFHTFHDTENLIANIKAKNAYMVSAVRVFDDDDWDGNIEGIAEQRHLRYSADASIESAKLFLLSLVNFPIGDNINERFDRIGAFGGIYKIPSLFLLALGCCYKFRYIANKYSNADKSLYDSLLETGDSVFYEGLDFYDFARDYYDKNFSRFFEEYKAIRKQETAKKLTGDADDDSDVEAMFEATDTDGGTEDWEIHYAYTKYNDNTKKFLIKWLDDMVFVYNAHGEMHTAYRTTNITPYVYPLNYTVGDIKKKKYDINSLYDADDCRQYFEVTDIVPAFIDTVRNLTNVLVADDVEALPPVPVAVSVDRKMAMYDVFKQIYDRWKIGDSDSRVELYTAAHINNNFIFRDTFNNEIGNDIRVDIKKLVDMLYSILNGTDNDMSVYSFLNQVCADAHCLMLSLPTNVYASFSGERALERLFTPQPYTSMSVPTSTTFIITYNHKYAEHLNYSEGESAYKDDGVDFRNHFVVKTNAGDNNQLAAFGITYSLGKQRFFNNIQVSMQKPQVTEQSLASLLSIANDGSTHGGLSLTYDHHDLFDTYSQHSYMCDVEMMGNAQIMPMMYFQLNNIPLFKGGYMIVSAEHTINKDGMKTSFKGARVSKYQFDFTKLSNSTAILYGEGDEGHVSTTTPEIVPSQYEGREFTHHSYSEFVRTNKTKNGSKIPNNPTDENIIENIFRCMEMMEIISEKWISHCTSKNYGEEVETRIFISSCYRCKSVNDACGSKDSSAHRTGDAIDFYVNYQNDLKTRSKYNQELFNDVLIPYLRDNKIPFDQLIVEKDKVDFQWLHLGLKLPSTGEQRKQVFRMDVKTEKSTDIKTPLF